MTRISRPCYDKPHRCPGWAGGGMFSAKVDRCADGRVTVKPRWSEVIPVAEGLFDDHPGAHPLRFGHCAACGVTTWPWATRRLDPQWWHARMSLAWRRLKWRIEDRRTRR
ncbi:hypothetical protein GCM10027273_12030 [Nocardioides pakistanensis]